MTTQQIPPMFIDTFEPEQIKTLIEQVIPAMRVSLNSMGFADYSWFAFDGHRIQVERKQVNEILGGIDHVEEQLRRELPKADENMLLIEGYCEPLSEIRSQIQTYHKGKAGNILVPDRVYNISYSGFQAWKSQIDKCGVTVVETSDYMATAITLTALYKNSMVVEHKTMRRYIKEKIHLGEFNPHVQAMIALGSAFHVEIGEKKAKALIDRYKTVWQVLQQEPEDLAETEYVGKGVARKLLEAVGKKVA